MPFPDSTYPSVLRGYEKRQSARLEAAAPALLAACKEMVLAFDRGAAIAALRSDEGDEMLALRSLRKAIAKAEGP